MDTFGLILGDSREQKDECIEICDGMEGRV